MQHLFLKKHLLPIWLAKFLLPKDLDADDVSGTKKPRAIKASHHCQSSDTANMPKQKMGSATCVLQFLPANGLIWLAADSIHSTHHGQPNPCAGQCAAPAGIFSHACFFNSRAYSGNASSAKASFLAFLQARTADSSVCNLTSVAARSWWLIVA